MTGMPVRLALAFLLSLVWCGAAFAVVAPPTPDPPPVEAPAPPAVTPPSTVTPTVPVAPQVDPAIEEQRQREAREAARELSEQAATERRNRIEELSDQVEADQAADDAVMAAGPSLEATEDHSVSGGGLVDTLLPAVIALIAVGLIGYMARRADPAWPLTIGICLTVFTGNWGLLGLPPLDRLFIAIGLFVLLARIGPSKDRPTLRLGPVHFLLLMVSVYAVLSSVWAGTIADPVAHFGLLDRLGIVPFIMFTVAPLAFRTPRQRSILLGGLVSLGAYLGITAVLETVGPRSLVFPAYILDPGVGIHIERARGPFVEAAANGLGLFVCAVAGFVAFSVWENVRLRIFAAAVTALCLFGTVFTLTRAIWLSTLLAGIITLLSARELRRYLFPAVGIAAIAVVAALAFVPSLQDNASERGTDQRPVWDRLNLVSAGQRMVEEKPILGFGWNRGSEDLVDYLRQADEYPLTASGLFIHNVYLANAVELGLLGTGLWLLALITAIGTSIARRGPPALRPWRIAMIAIAVQWAIVANFVPLFFAFPNLILWVWAGVLSTQYVEGAEDIFRLPPEGDEDAPIPNPELVYELHE